MGFPVRNWENGRKSVLPFCISQRIRQEIVKLAQKQILFEIIFLVLFQHSLIDFLGEIVYNDNMR